MGAETIGLGSLGLNGRVTEKSTNYVEYIKRCVIVFSTPWNVCVLAVAVELCFQGVHVLVNLIF